ncbi:NYN domain-containing protein [Atopobacter sp. AH10]|uniref:YacP-like NYN domain-containing protein n=1 Tax=Atopobacter sp. AH10 TaxID=2315861 RepID=UPI000EF22A2E|nr:NYN domain-containing protein [Atopobacter sp. AH10]RLK62797.1 NYN domain-containing protein [Atopobacter sp. AH10]
MKRRLLIVDGYNIIGAWPTLANYQKKNQLEEARDELLFRLSEYAKLTETAIVVVFDAQFVPGIEQVYDQYQLSVVYTKEGETADSYIERTVRECLSPLLLITVATSDLAEQWLVFQQGALRKSARELYKDVAEAHERAVLESRDYRKHGVKRHSPWRADQLLQLKDLLHDLSQEDGSSKE